jgi:glycosyltransferase involved in cell wall biosynthesis
MNILALTKYSYEGPSSRYRFYNYRECFSRQGIKLTIRPLFSHTYLNTSNKTEKLLTVIKAYFQRIFLLMNVLCSKQRYDILIIEYELLPYFPALFEYLLQKKGIKYIVDYDDAIFHKYDMSKNKIVRFLLKNKIAKVIQYAEHVIVCNAYLENYVKAYSTNILRLPTVVLLDKYKEIMHYPTKKVDNIFVIGWIGSKSTSPYIMNILPALTKMMGKYDNIHVNLVGFDKKLLSDETLNKYPIKVEEWEEEKEIEDILHFDVGIMPLHDDPWSRGKCGFKLVQYMSCKKPVVASPIGINSSLVNDGENGFLAKSIDEWERALERLYKDDQLREVMAKKNFQKIENEFNHHKVCLTYGHLIQKLGEKVEK